MKILRIVAIIPIIMFYSIGMLLVCHYSPNYTINLSKLGYAKRCFISSFNSGYSLLFCVSELHYFLKIINSEFTNN